MNRTKTIMTGVQKSYQMFTHLAMHIHEPDVRTNFHSVQRLPHVREEFHVSRQNGLVTLTCFYGFKMGIRINLMPSNFYHKLGMNKNNVAWLSIIEVITTETSMVTTILKGHVLFSLVQMQQGRGEVYTLKTIFTFNPLTLLQYCPTLYDQLLWKTYEVNEFHILWYY